MLQSLASPQATQACMMSYGHTDFRNEVIKINVPTLIIHGGSDKQGPLGATSEQTAQLLPESIFITYDGAPHGLFYTEKERLNKDLISFIKEGKISEHQAAGIPDGYVVLPSNEALITR